MTPKFKIQITYTDGAVYTDPVPCFGFYAAEKAARKLAEDKFDDYGSFVAVRVIGDESQTEHLYLRVGG